MNPAIILLALLLVIGCDADTAGLAQATPDSAPSGQTGSAFGLAPFPAQEDLRSLAADEEKLDLYCLKKAYPGIQSLETLRNGDKMLITKDGQQIPYTKAHSVKEVKVDSDFTTVKESLRLPYPLEPMRPDLPDGFSPGRLRSKALLAWLYGDTKESVSRGLGGAKFRGKTMRMHREPLEAFKRAIPELDKLAAQNPRLKAYLEPAGGFNWRRIAGENRLSPHSYGIAFDIGVKVSPYWRWAKINPHPVQKSYPPEIVRVMEENGFIWGGKWHEYDIMHFEYRPELICKARIMRLGSTDIEIYRD